MSDAVTADMLLEFNADMMTGEDVTNQFEVVGNVRENTVEFIKRGKTIHVNGKMVTNGEWATDLALKIFKIPAEFFPKGETALTTYSIVAFSATTQGDSIYLRNVGSYSLGAGNYIVITGSWQIWGGGNKLKTFLSHLLRGGECRG